MMELQLWARILVASGIPATASAADVRITSQLTLSVESDGGYVVAEQTGKPSFDCQWTPELSVVVDQLRDKIAEFAPAHTKVRLEGSTFQPDFQQMDHAEIAAWRLEVIGYDWICDEPDIELEAFQNNAQSYWNGALADMRDMKADRPKGNFEGWGWIIE